MPPASRTRDRVASAGVRGGGAVVAARQATAKKPAKPVKPAAQIDGLGRVPLVTSGGQVTAVLTAVLMLVLTVSGERRAASPGPETASSNR
ncbi:hypothetical protein NDU88_007569 [Pleurodeles waltl]|uniref:Uncharacterized protein n=1 Tax=Pleurodeles waltl TaxID=8319 RepID=A0AAV7P177_PLEWA|nr:hypothetical protein NDU88_007569 [Pleurodeles waltl]